MNPSWKNDPRLKRISAQKLRLLTEFADSLAQAPPNKKMELLLRIHLSFSSQERELLFQVLSEHMTPEERSQANMIQSFAAKQKPKTST